MRHLQSIDERECRYIFTTDGNHDEQILEVADIRLEAVALPHVDGEEVVVILLGPRWEAY